MYVVNEKLNNEYRSFSKRNKQTIKTNTIKKTIEKMGGTDILTHNDE